MTDAPGNVGADEGAAWLAAMRGGDWDTAWRLCDRALARHPQDGFDDQALPPHRRTVWPGTDPAGRHVLVRCHHGLGDTIMACRFMPLLRRRAASAALAVQPELTALLWATHADPACIVAGDTAIPCDLAIESLELAHALRVTPSLAAAQVPYLRLPLQPPPPRRGEAAPIGLVWRAGEWNPRRSLDLSDLSPLWALRGFLWLSLQRGPGRMALDSPGHPVTDASSADALTLAERLARLHAVVAVDSFVANLAGAMGLPVHVLLPTDADWRWGTGSVSPWYPTARLYRQHRPGDWSGPVRDLAAALKARSVGAD